MKRSFLIAACVLPLAALVFFTRQPTPPTAIAQPKKPAKVEPWPFVVGPYLQYATADSITILWETAEPGTSTVRYGIGTPTKVKEGDKEATMHEVSITGLESGKPYVYEVESKIGDRVLKSPLLTFQPALGENEVFSFVLIGDTQKNPRVTNKVATLAWQRRPNFVVHLGDVVDAGPDKKEWVHELFGPCKELFARVPVYPCIGNHEKNHAFYYQYFALPKPEYYYQFRYGNADFFSLDTNKKVGPGTEQYKWLDAALGKSTAKWKIVYHHHPAYSSDDNDFGDTWKGIASKQGDPNVRQLVALYEKHNVDFVFNGHIHVYERTWPLRAGKIDHKTGIRYITSGGGGGKLEDFSPVPTWFKAQCRSDYHYCYATVHGGRLSFKAFDHMGMLFDTFEVEKEAK